MFGGSSRQPILAVQRRRNIEKKRNAPTPQRKGKHSSLPLPWLLGTIIVLSLATSHFLLPSIKRHDKLSQTLDSDHEIYSLHHEPSSHFCALRQRPKVCAHGGDIDVAPPNTLASFVASLDGGADCVEVDVSMTKDGHLVALHDRDLAALLENSGAAAGLSPPAATPRHHRRNLIPSWRTRRDSAFLPRTSAYTWDQLQRLHWSPGGPGVAPFHSVLSMLLNYKHQVAVTVDVKLRESLDEREEAAAMAQAVADVLHSVGCGMQCMVWAKSDAVPAVLKSLNKRQRVGLVVLNETIAARAAGMDQPLRLASLGVEVAGVHYGMVSPELAQSLRQLNREVHVWTANTARMMKIALDAGPDAVVTNRPKKLLEALDSRSRACERQRQRP